MTDRREYDRNHWKIRHARGSARLHPCVIGAELGVGEQAREWAHVHGTDGDDPWADYVPMCIRHHRQYDRVNRTSRWYERGERMAELNRSRRGVPLSPEHRAKVIKTLTNRGRPVGIRFPGGYRKKT